MTKNPSATSESGMVIIIPAYKELENITELVARIRKLHPGIRILIVDDSPPSEQRILRIQLRRFNKAEMLTRSVKSGRGSAVLDGMRHALRDRTVSAVLEMDADLSHQPEDIAKFLQHRSDSDIIIGSRYIKGSRIVDWPESRYIQSRIINTFLTYWLAIGIHDYTNGFRLYNRPVAEFLAGYPLKERGYIALSESAFQAYRHGFTLSEVPTTFLDRYQGKSKADARELLSSLYGAFRIRFGK